MTNAVGGGQAYALTCDEDNRVASFNWDCGLTSKINTNRYDAFGRRVARTIDANEVRFVLNLATDMERVLCDVTPFGEITAWYVHGLDLCCKVDAADTLTCYHPDAQANIIALIGAGGTNLVRYAYTPYGRSPARATTPPTGRPRWRKTPTASVAHKASWKTCPTSISCAPATTPPRRACSCPLIR